MRTFIGACLGVAGVVLSGYPALAQERAASGGRGEIAAFPGGGVIFTESTGATDFANYAAGGSFTYNFNRYVGVEGEGGASFGVEQRLDLRSGVRSVRPPNTLTYSGNAVVYPTGNNRALVPYATGGIGGLTLFERAELGVNDTTTFLTGNAGGGVKYFFSKRWGLRGDYRFFAVRSRDVAPSFFGRDTRYGHRVYGGIVLNVLR